MRQAQKNLQIQSADLWLARGAILVVAGLQFGIVNDLTVGPH
jgi:hypothetical protein